MQFEQKEYGSQKVTWGWGWLGWKSQTVEHGKGYALLFTLLQGPLLCSLLPYSFGRSLGGLRT